jgi:hypothetical protein
LPLGSSRLAAADEPVLGKTSKSAIPGAVLGSDGSEGSDFLSRLKMNYPEVRKARYE